jgi:hypothetical protein
MVGFILPKNGCKTHFGSENIMDVSKVPSLDIRVDTLDFISVSDSCVFIRVAA